jgi:hypothetical protein
LDEILDEMARAIGGRWIAMNFAELRAAAAAHKK